MTKWRPVDQLPASIPVRPLETFVTFACPELARVMQVKRAEKSAIVPESGEEAGQ